MGKVNRNDFPREKSEHEPEHIIEAQEEVLRALCPCVIRNLKRANIVCSYRTAHYSDFRIADDFTFEASF